MKAGNNYYFTVSREFFLPIVRLIRIVSILGLSLYTKIHYSGIVSCFVVSCYM